jgi:pimeloyl-ACP methyl ester carboxylesterase
MTTYLALHYWAGSGREFEPLLPLLPPDSNLLAPDLPGFGDQAAPAGFDYSVASYADWVAQYIAEHQLVDYHIIGHSMGGKVAMLLAARRPAGLRSLLLLSPSPPTPEPISDADRAASLAAYGQPDEAEKTFNKITSIPLSSAQHTQVVADNLRTTQAAWEAWLMHGSREDISSEVATIEVPCRLLAGENDQAISPAVQRQQTLPLLPPGTMMAVAPGAGHLLPLEAPEEIFKGQYPI